MDCVIHAINMLLGFPYFKSREQFIKVYAFVKRKSEQEVADVKQKKGLTLFGLKSFVASQSQTFTAALILEWNREQIEKKIRGKRYIYHYLQK